MAGSIRKLSVLFGALLSLLSFNALATSPGSLSFSASTYSVNQTAGSATISVIRTGGSSGAVSTVFTTGNGTAVGGTDYSPNSGTLSWADGDASAKTFTVKLGSTAFSGTKNFIVNLLNPAGGATLLAPTQATVTVTGAAPGGVLALSSSAYSIVQNGGAVQVTVTRTGSSSGAVSTVFTTGNGSAVAGVDFTPNSGTLSWASGDMTAKTFTVQISNASPFNGTKSFSVSLLSPGGGAALGSPSAATISITGATPGGIVGLSAQAYTVAQNDGSVTFTVNRTNGSTGIVSVVYSTGNGSASGGTDFGATSGTLTWPSGDTSSKSFTVQLGNVAAYTGSKYFTVSLLFPSGGAVLASPSTANVTILGNGGSGAGSLSFSAPVYAVAQNAGKLVVGVSRTGGSSGAVSVVFTTGNGTAAGGTDFSPLSGTLNWAAGDYGVKTFTISIANTTPYAGSKSFSVSLLSPTGGALLGTPNFSTVTVNGTAIPGILTMSSPTYSVAQNAGKVTVTVNRTNGSYGTVSATYSTSNGTASGGTDFSPASGTLTWPDGDTTAKTFSVAIANTASFTGSKSFTVGLVNPIAGVSLGSPTTATVNINGTGGSGPGVLSLSAPSYTVAQTGGSVVIAVSRTGGSTGAVSVVYSTGNGSAAAGTDYGPSSGTLNWAAGDVAPKSFTVGISNATPYAGSKTLTVSLFNVTGGATLATAGATITINGSAVPGFLTFAAPSFTVAQKGGSVLITVNRINGSTGAISTTFSTGNGSGSTAAYSGYDFSPTSGTLSWASGDTSPKTFSVPISNVTPFAGAKSLVVNLFSPTGGAALITPYSSTVTINGSLGGALGFSATAYSVAQNAGTATITVNRTGTAVGAVSVVYSTGNGSAAGGTDFTPISGTLNWADGDPTSKSFTVAISNAKPFTGNKNFTVTLFTPSGGASLSAPSASTVTINGNGGSGPGILGLSAPTYTVNQSAGTISIAVSRSGGSTGAVSTVFTTGNGTASAGADYGPNSGTLSWADGDTAAKTFTVAISGTTPFQGMKTFAVTLLSPGGGATLASPSTSTVTINGSVGGALALSASSYTVAQNNGLISIGVTRSGSSNGAISVSYTTSNNTAIAGPDYGKASGSLSWSDGDISTKTIQISVSNTAFTGIKVFKLALYTPLGGATLAAPSAATVTITGSKSGTPMGQLAAARLLMQGTFGPTIDDINSVATQDYATWFASQKSYPMSLTLPSVEYVLPTDVNWANFWFDNVCLGPDQLRQRMAFALSEIMVIADNAGGLGGNNPALAAYYDILTKDALGNYRTLLQDVTLSPAMGAYLNLWHSDKPNTSTGVHADQNYAREVMQLFSIGLVMLNPDGTPQLDGTGAQIPAYTQNDVQDMANILTGWSSTPTNGQTGDTAWQYSQDWLDPMVGYEDHHDSTDSATILGVSVPAGGTTAQDLQIALDTLANHPNVGPFISKQLIQRLVTSNPSPAYVQRVASVFNNDGSGVRGNLMAVAQAILTDQEAVNPGGNNYGKLREPLIRLTGLWRAFGSIDYLGGIDEDSIISGGGNNWGQYPLESPSVFNFFRPDYQLAGPISDAGLVSPEYQITNENSLVLTDNKLAVQAYQFMDSKGVSYDGVNSNNPQNLTGTSVLLHTAEWEPYAADPTSLVNELNLVLMAGQMPSSMQTGLANYIAAIPSTSAGSRVAESAELVISSPQYAVQR